MADVDFWFELASPYSYLSATQIDAQARTRGVSVRWRPFLLGPIFAAQGWDTSPFRIYPAKGRYMWRDVKRRCALRGVRFKTPPNSVLHTFPLNSVAAARLAVVGLDEGWGKAFVHSVFEAEFANHHDISDETILAGLLANAGANPQAAFASSRSGQNKPRLRGNTETAQALGIFGAPSFTVGDELFWGDDRLEDALDWAKDGRSRRNAATDS